MQKKIQKMSFCDTLLKKRQLFDILFVNKYGNQLRVVHFLCNSL